MIGNEQARPCYLCGMLVHAGQEETKWNLDWYGSQWIHYLCAEDLGEAALRVQGKTTLGLALSRLEEWQRAAMYLLEHYPEDVFPPNGNTPDAKAGTFARRLLTWLLDPVERARLAALAHSPEEANDG